MVSQLEARLAESEAQCRATAESADSLRDQLQALRDGYDRASGQWEEARSLLEASLGAERDGRRGDAEVFKSKLEAQCGDAERARKELLDEIDVLKNTLVVRAVDAPENGRGLTIRSSAGPETAVRYQDLRLLTAGGCTCRLCRSKRAAGTRVNRRYRSLMST